MKKQENPIYSKINYEDAYSAEKSILGAQISLLNIIKIMENYRILRKQELMLKLKLKNDLKNTKEDIAKLIEQAPKTQVINERITKNKEKSKIKKEHKELSNVESELENIQRKLQEMG